MQPYHVIEFEELPYANIDKYISVPNTWIKWRDEPKGKVIVAYPVEEPSCTLERVRKYEIYSRNWKTYLAFVEHATNSYDEAETIIKYLKNKRIREPNELNKKRSCENPSTVPIQNGTDASRSSDVLDSAANETNVAVALSADKIIDPSVLLYPAEARAEPSSVILPREYDPNYPRWTLKYKSCNSGRNTVRLMELKPGGKNSGIYINHRGYLNCFAVSMNNMSLAENLMQEVFTKTALKVCALTEGIAVVNRGEDIEEEIRRPGLYDHAVNVLDEFVLLHGFGDGDEKSIKEHLSRKLDQLKPQF